jgi:hypothetical protein
MGDYCIMDAADAFEHEEFDKVSKRRKRQLRSAMFDYGRRLFVEDDKAPRG